MIGNSESEKMTFVDDESKRIREEIAKLILEYPSKINRMAADVPIGVLCLPKAIEKLLLDNGCLRVHDIVDLDLAEVEWLTDRHVRNLTSRLDQFFSML